MEMDEDMEHDIAEISEKDKKAYVPGVSRALKEGEELDFDPEAYSLFHTWETNWPCLSFSIVNDTLGSDRISYPMQAYLVAGTQADKAKDNELIVMGLKNITGMKHDCDSSSEEESDDEDNSANSEPVLHSIVIPHHGGVNRVKSERLGDSSVVAVWNDLGKVQVWNVTGALNDAHGMEGRSSSRTLKDQKPLFSFQGHKREGFALGWSHMKKGDLASGDQSKEIYVWHMHEGGQWAVDQRPFKGHKNSIEDVQWSPTEDGLLVSCSSDKSIRLWDTRASPADACVCTVENAHDSDINVLSWNMNDTMILTGGDDATLKIWSLKTIQFGQSVAKFKHHTGPITSVEWHPNDATTFMASGEDNQTSIWDIATEVDSAGDTVEGVPPQLMFLHLGQQEIKEVHWHSQCPGLAMTTALSGFNVFKTINC